MLVIIRKLKIITLNNAKLKITYSGYQEKNIIKNIESVK